MNHHQEPNIQVMYQASPFCDLEMHHQDQNLNNMDQALPFRAIVKKLCKFVLPISVFSFFFLSSSWLPLFFQSIVNHNSTFSSQLLSLATDKNYIFLICNGILVFIAKYPNLKAKVPSLPQPETTPDNDLIFKEYTQNLQPSVEDFVLLNDMASVNDHEGKNSEANDAALATEEVEVKDRQLVITHNEQGRDEDYVNSGDECQDEEEEYVKEESENDFAIEEDEEDEMEEEECTAKMSTEELNRKFDDFIRRMKEEIRIEAQQQLIMV